MFGLLVDTRCIYVQILRESDSMQPDQGHPRTHLFLVRLWVEPFANDQCEVRMRKLLRKSSSRAFCGSGGLVQICQKRLGGLEFRHVKTFAEPTVDSGQQAMGFCSFALLLPQARQAHAGA